MRLQIEINNTEPLKVHSGVRRELTGIISGYTLYGALLNMYLIHECPYSSTKCLENNCEKYSDCPIKPVDINGLNELSMKISFAHILCPECRNGRLINTPSTWLYCKSCARQGIEKDDLIIEYDPDAAEAAKCKNCGSSAAMVEYNGWVCNNCNKKYQNIIFSKDVTGIGIDPKKNSVIEGILYTFPVLLPGYHFIFTIETENERLISFIKSLKGKIMYIGGARSKGYGASKIIEVKEIMSNDYEGDKFMYITPGIVNSNNLGEIDIKNIKHSNGKLSFTSFWIDNGTGGGYRSDNYQTVEPGSVIILNDKIIPNNNNLNLFGEFGYGELAPIPKLEGDENDRK